MANNKKVKYFLAYTILFCVLAAAVYFPFWSHGKGLIRYSDGLQQFYYSLRYFGNYLREYASGIANGIWEPPMWDMSIGYGSDILTTLHTYAIGDPLNLLAVFADGNGTELLANFLVVFRIYLSGLAFAAFSFYHNNGVEETLLGALVYSFCGWGLVSGMAYFSFSNPMIYFPLICLGVDKIFREKKPYLFEIMLAVTAFSSFYFLYMICILSVVYVTARYIQLRYPLSVKEEAKWIGRFAAYAGVGIGMGAVVVVPVAVSMLSQQRLQQQHDISPLYSLGFYISLVKSLTTFTVPLNEQAAFGFAAIVLPGLVLFFMKKGNRMLKLGIMAAFLGLMLPFWGKLMNGFSYPANRWVWALSLLIGYMIVKVWPCFGRLSGKEKAVLAVVGVLLIPYWLVVCEKITAGLVLLEMIFAAALLDAKKMKAARPLIFLLTAVSIGVNAYGIFEVGDLTKNWRNNLDFGTIDRQARSLPGNMLAGRQGASRYDTVKLQDGVYPNSDFVLGLHGTGFKFSTSDAGTSRFMDDLYVNCFSGINFDGLDNRSILDLLAGVRYFIVKDEDKGLMPWSYRTDGRRHDGYLIGESRESLPLGYTYDRKMSYEAWKKLPAAERQYALLQGMVVEDTSAGMPKLLFEAQRLSCQARPEADFDRTAGINTGMENEEVRLRTDSRPGCEYYVVFRNLGYEGEVPVADIKVSAGNREKTVSYATQKQNQSTGKRDYLCCLGYFEHGPDRIKLTFVSPGSYSWDSVDIVCQPMSSVKSLLDQRRENALTDVKIGNNMIGGTIQLKDKKSLCVAVPYSDGWTAYVDGRKTPLYQANIMFMGMDLGSGKHRIELYYATPGIAAGAVISAVCFLLFTAQCIGSKMHRRGDKPCGFI